MAFAARVLLLMTAAALGGLPLAAAEGLPPCPPGWDAKNWADLEHRNPKYVIGRIIAAYPHTPDGLRQALPRIQSAYPGTKIIGSKEDKIAVPGVGVIDVIRAAGEGGKAWQWLPAGQGGGEKDSDPDEAEITVPDRSAVVLNIGRKHPEIFARACKSWEFLNLVVETLRVNDVRWGYSCKLGDCKKPSRNMIAYYTGPGAPPNGSSQALLVEIILGHCDSKISPGWQPLEDHQPVGWTTRGRFRPASRTSKPNLIEDVMSD